MSANEVNEAINSLWSILRSAGIADELTIIEHIARLLLDESGLEISLPDRLLPRCPPQRDEFGYEFDKLKHNLKFAANQMGGDDKVQQFATLFDQHVLFRLSEMLAGGRYPTPRHVTSFMRVLAQVRPDDALADFACGSGGLLMAWDSEDKQGARIYGVEISPEWARIARANLLLHKIPLQEDSIEDGNALSMVGESAKKFNRILINPPFGEKVDPAISNRVLGQKVGRSETALIMLALINLAPDGVAGVLTPSGLLFSNSSADKALRTRLVDENTLKAVIAFPKDAFQPYSPLQTNLLLFTKRYQPENHLTWFFQLEQDGYPSGRSRNLTQYPPPQTSDFPFVEHVWARNSNDDAQFPNSDSPTVGVHWILGETGHPGVVCWGLTRPLKSVEFIDLSATESAVQETEVEAIEPPQLHLELMTPPTEPKVTVKIPIPNTVWTSPRSTFAATTAYTKELEPKVEEAEETPQVEPTSTKLLTRPVWVAAIAFFKKGQGTIGERPRLLGVAVRSTDIHQQAYDLRPENYVVTPVESQPLDSPTKLLANIYRNQRQLSKRLDNLFGHLELPPIATQKLPSPISGNEELPLVGGFNKEQKAIWIKVRQKTETVIEKGAANYETAALFTPEDISANDSKGVAETTYRTLDLMERMGLIVPVTISKIQSDESPFFYRRITERDLWQSDLEKSNSGEET